MKQFIHFDNQTPELIQNLESFKKQYNCWVRLLVQCYNASFEDLLLSTNDDAYNYICRNYGVLNIENAIADIKKHSDHIKIEIEEQS